MFLNGEFIDDEVVRLEAAQIKQRLRNEMSAGDALEIEIRARELARETVVERVLLRQAALRDAQPIPDSVIDEELRRYYAQNPHEAGCHLPRDRDYIRKNIENDLYIANFLRQLTAHIPKPADKQVAALYRDAKQALVQPETVRAAHIVKNIDESQSEAEALAAIEDIQSLLAQGVPFESVADQHSDCPGRGGDLGFFERGQMVDEFETQVLPLPVGVMSPIFHTPFGFHIAKVLERVPERIPPLAEIRHELSASLWQRQKQGVIRAFLDDLRAQAVIRKSK